MSNSPTIPSVPEAPKGSYRHHIRSLVHHAGDTVYESPRQDFYEGKWPEPDYSSGSLRNWLVRKQRFFLRHLPQERAAKVLDLGCGGGWKLFTRAGLVVGIDMSHRSLLGARSLYHGATVGDLTYLPYQDATFDLVVSSDVLGHIPLEHKQQVIQEIYRVLKPQGRTLHYIEAEGTDPLTRFAKGYPLLYQRYIMGPEGHEGLESPSATFQRFRDAGFRPVQEVAAYRLLMYVGRVAQLFDNEYARHSLQLKMAVQLCKLLSAWHPLELLSNLGVALVLEITDRIFPESWGSGVLVEYLKRA